MTTRILHVIVQPVLVNDDGAELTAGPEAHPAHIPVSQIPAYVQSLIDEVRKMNAEDGSGG